MPWRTPCLASSFPSPRLTTRSQTMDEPNATVRPNVGTKDKTVGWYDQTFHGIEPAARELLEKYSHIPPEEVDQYVIAMVLYTETLFLPRSPISVHGKTNMN